MNDVMIAVVQAKRAPREQATWMSKSLKDRKMIETRHSHQCLLRVLSARLITHCGMWTLCMAEFLLDWCQAISLCGTARVKCPALKQHVRRPGTMALTGGTAAVHA